MMYLPTAETFAFSPPPMQVDNSPYMPEAAEIATAHLIRLLGAVRSGNQSTTTVP
jgi:hypothetical protein